MDPRAFQYGDFCGRWWEWANGRRHETGGSCFPLYGERQSGDDEYDAICARGNPLVESALEIAETTAESAIRYDAKPDLVGDQHNRRCGSCQRGFKPLDLCINICPS